MSSYQLALESSDGINPPSSSPTKGDGPPTLTLGRKEVKSLVASELKDKRRDRRRKRNGMRWDKMK